MPHIKRIVIIRLFIGWLMISALTAVTIYWIESRRIDEAIIALAANESQHFAAESIDTRTIRPAELAVLRQQAAEFVRDSYVSIKGYDHEGSVVFDVCLLYTSLQRTSPETTCLRASRSHNLYTPLFIGHSDHRLKGQLFKRLQPLAQDFSPNVQLSLIHI